MQEYCLKIVVAFLFEETILSFDNQFALNYIKKKILKCTTIFKS